MEWQLEHFCAANTCAPEAGDGPCAGSRAALAVRTKASVTIELRWSATETLRFLMNVSDRGYRTVRRREHIPAATFSPAMARLSRGSTTFVRSLYRYLPAEPALLALPALAARRTQPHSTGCVLTVRMASSMRA